MSVINQMLKELEQRQGNDLPDPSQVTSTQIQKKSSFKALITFVIVVIVLLNIVGLYMWNLYTENQHLKKSVTQPNIENIAMAERSASIVYQVDDNKHVENKDNVDATASSFNNISEEKVNNYIVPVEPEAFKIEQTETLESTLLKKETHKVIAVKNVSLADNQVSVKTKNTVATPITKPLLNVSNNSISPDKEEKGLHTDLVHQEVLKPSLSISRSKASPERVVKKKFEKAERALLDNEIPKAEKLFEDIILIQPNHKSARKQLAALWFGRKLFQPAVNLLSKGVELYPRDVDFRLMKARVLLSQNYKKEAFYVLNGDATVQHAQYQALLATTAESLGKVKSVILAYKQLTNIEQHKSKWWLGLAVALDRDSQFEEAKIAYEMALSKGSLSSNSAQFVKQRMTELGE